ncbi:MAG: magnesium transporter CorA family protein [Candidatus Limnocylindria bacterium]
MIESAIDSFQALVRHADGTVEALDPDRLDELDQLTATHGNLVWVSAVAPDDAAIDVLRREFDLHPLAIEDVRKQKQRPKLDTYASGPMVVVYEAVEGQDPSEIHLFVGPAWLLSVSWAATPLVDAARQRFANGGDRAARNIGRLLYSVLDAAVDSYFPELDRLSDRIDELESRVLEGDADPDSLREVLSIKRRLLELRRVLAPMRDLANQLLRRDLDIVDEATVPYYQDLYDHLVRVIDQLDVYRDLLATVLDARLTVASNSLTRS